MDEDLTPPPGGCRRDVNNCRWRMRVRQALLTVEHVLEEKNFSLDSIGLYLAFCYYRVFGRHYVRGLLARLFACLIVFDHSTSHSAVRHTIMCVTLGSFRHISVTFLGIANSWLNFHINNPKT